MKKRKIFLILWINCLVLLLVINSLGFGFYLKKTSAAFGNVTGQITVPYKIRYLSNFPSEFDVEEYDISDNVVGESYVISANKFVLTRYEFVGWNTMRDGTGDEYYVNQEIPLNKNLDLYAQWVLIMYGDVNQNGVIDTDDYLLIEKSIADGVQLTGLELINADVNEDDKVDLIDADIIKQVCLGTEGYVGSLPSKPLLVYELYKSEVVEDSNEDISGEIDNQEPNGDTNEDGSAENDNSGSDINNSEDNSNSQNDSAGGSGTGSSGTGTGSSGNGSSSGNKNGSSNSTSGNIDSDSTLDEDTDKENDDSNNIVLEEEKDNDFLISEDNEVIKEDEKKSSYVVFIVLGICLVAVRLIFHVIYKFKLKENKKE